MNRIEDEWLHLKWDELACRVFEDEFDLAMAIIESVQARAKFGGYKVERFIFNQSKLQMKLHRKELLG